MRGAVYERQVDQVLTGGWNLLPPGDLLNKAEALQIENFRIDQAGNLRSRYGHGAPVVTTGPVRSFCKVKGNSERRYAATYQGRLFRDVTPIDAGVFGDVSLGAVTGGFASIPIGMVSYQGFLWAMGRNAQKKDNGTSLLSWAVTAPADPVVAVSAGGFLTPQTNYTYWITYAATGGQESPANDTGTTVPTTATDLTNTITSPAASGDTQVIGWNVYRIGDTLQVALRLNATPIAIGTNFVDDGDAGRNLSDIQLTDIGIELDPNAAGPPAGTGLAGPYYEHLLAWGVAAHPNRLYWSGTLQPYNFPGSNLDEGNHVDIGELGEAIVGVTIRPRVATIYKDSSIWRLGGDPDDNGDLELVTDELGAIGGQAIVTVGGVDYFQGPEGLYQNTGSRPTKITGKLDPLFRGERPEAAGFSYSTGIRLNQNPAALKRNCLAHRRGRLYFFYCGGDQSFLPNRGITQEIGADNWASDSRPIMAMLNEGTGAVDEQTEDETNSGLMLASIGSYLPGDPGPTAGVNSIEEGFDDGTRIAPIAIPLSYHSGYKDQGAPDQTKTYADVVITHNTGGAPLTVGCFYNNGIGPIPDKLGEPKEAIGTIQSTERTVSTFQLALGSDNLGIKARNIAVRIEGDAGSAAPVIIYNIAVHYFLEARDSKTYDSDETDLGSEKVKLLLELELDIDFPALGGGATAWELFTDRGGTRAGSGLPSDETTNPPPTPTTGRDGGSTVIVAPPSVPAVTLAAIETVARLSGMIFQNGEWYIAEGLILASSVAGDVGITGLSPFLYMVFEGLGLTVLAQPDPGTEFRAAWPATVDAMIRAAILYGGLTGAAIPPGYGPALVPPPAPVGTPSPLPATPSGSETPLSDPPAPIPPSVPGVTGTAVLLRDFGHVPTTSGREIVRIPLPGTPAGSVEGRLVRLCLRNDTTFFRLYGARARVLPYGEYIDNQVGEVFETLPINVGMN